MYETKSKMVLGELNRVINRLRSSVVIPRSLCVDDEDDEADDERLGDALRLLRRR